MLLVTSLNRTGFHQYGKRMLQTLNDVCKLPVRVYSEDDLTTELKGLSGKIDLRSLHDVPGWKEFARDSRHIEPQSYIFDARRFCHKVYAQLDAFESKHRYVVWLDADVVVKKKFGEKFIKDLLDGEMCAFLGRAQSYTETGFIAFDTHHPDFKEFKKRYREWYDKRYLYMLPYWIDCLAFDASKHELSQKNLTPNAQGMMDVFSQSHLKEYFDHDKGLRKHRRGNEPVLQTA